MDESARCKIYEELQERGHLRLSIKDELLRPDEGRKPLFLFRGIHQAHSKDNFLIQKKSLIQSHDREQIYRN
jgi:hypothetical protein